MAVPGVEHISILYAPQTHRATVARLDASFGGPLNDQPLPSPLRRIGGAARLTLGFLVGFYPLARLLLPGGGGGPRFDPPVVARAAAVTVVAAVPAVFRARILPFVRLPIAIGGYVVGFAAVIGALLIAYGKWRPMPHPEGRGWRGFPLPGYAVAAIALPIDRRLTHAVPPGQRDHDHRRRNQHAETGAAADPLGAVGQHRETRPDQPQLPPSRTTGRSVG